MNYNQSLILHIQGISPLIEYKEMRVDIIFDDGNLSYQSFSSRYKQGNFHLAPLEEPVDLSNLKAYPKRELYLIRIWLPLELIVYGCNWYALYEEREREPEDKSRMISLASTFDDFHYKGEEYVEIHSSIYHILSNPSKYYQLPFG
jgi:hypothetical protein